MTSSRFNKWTAGTEVAQVFEDQIRGKHVLITGASPQSLGEAAALAIASAKPAMLILASRTPSKLSSVARRVREEAIGVRASASPASTASAHATTIVETVHLDLASQASVRQAARDIAAITTRIDVLINNAGINVHRRQLSPDGIELTFATNHVGPFLLTQLLLPLLLNAAGSGPIGATRVVNVSSGGHHISPMRFSDYNFEGKPLPPDEEPRKGLPDWVHETDGGFPGTLAYGMSKCANVLFTVALKERLQQRGIDSFAVDPGVVRTDLTREIGPGSRKELELLPQMSPDQGCAVLLVAAFDPSLSASGTIYLRECRVSRPASYASDKANADKLWALSEKLTKSSATGTKL